MCLIVHKESANSEFTLSQFYTSYTRNTDGLGIMYVEDDRVKVEKVVGDYKAQLELFKKHQDRDMYCLHQRFKTKGLINRANCHPYKILDYDEDGIDLYMMHNGTMSVPIKHQDMSDTWHFAEYYLKPILKADPNLINNEQFQELISGYIGTGNKLLFLNNYGEVLIFNEDKGHNENGCWFSNQYSIKPAVVSTYNNRGGYGMYANNVDKYYEDETEAYCGWTNRAGNTSLLPFVSEVQEEEEDEYEEDEEVSAYTEYKIEKVITEYNNNLDTGFTAEALEILCLNIQEFNFSDLCAFCDTQPDVAAAALEELLTRFKDAA